MNIRRNLIAGVAIAVCGFSTQAHARADKLSMYEVEKFVASYQNAVNSPSIAATNNFLQNNVDTSAIYKNKVNQDWSAPPTYYHPVWAGAYGSPYYRYPYAPNYYQPTSLRAGQKLHLIADIQHKKSIIPNYRQSITLRGVNLAPDSRTATLQVELRESGLVYGAPAPNVTYNQQLQLSNANCNMHLKKQNGHIQVTMLNCNTNANGYY